MAAGLFRKPLTVVPSGLRSPAPLDTIRGSVMYGRSYCWMAKPQTSGILFPLLSTWTFLASSTTWSQVSRSLGSVPGIFSPAALKRSVLTNRPTLVEPIGAEIILPL